MKRKEKVRTCGNCASLRKANPNVLENGKRPRYYVWICDAFFGGRKPTSVCERHVFKRTKITQNA
jgi:hypothetical protein